MAAPFNNKIKSPESNCEAKICRPTVICSIQSGVNSDKYVGIHASIFLCELEKSWLKWKLQVEILLSFCAGELSHVVEHCDC